MQSHHFFFFPNISDTCGYLKKMLADVDTKPFIILNNKCNNTTFVSYLLSDLWHSNVVYSLEHFWVSPPHHGCAVSIGVQVFLLQ